MAPTAAPMRAATALRRAPPAARRTRRTAARAPRVRTPASSSSGGGPPEVDAATIDESAVYTGEPTSQERPSEAFMVRDAKFKCASCSYEYDKSKGDPEYPVSAGTEFAQLPEDWTCPTCGAAKGQFRATREVVAGFAENQGYGFGTNSMTGGQKSGLIYGSLFAFFILFLLGYLLD